MALKTTEKPTLETQFHSLADEWKRDCALLSSTSAMVAHPAYKAIIKLGPPAVPLLLRDLEQSSAHWFEALSAITGQDPVSREDWGNISAMRNAWLNWGRSQNLL